MTQSTPSLTTTVVDQLGERLRAKLTVEDLRLLDKYRREFGSDYDSVVSSVREALGFEVSGRPAKSTTAIIDKLNRGSMRLSQMQDIAGCRVIVSDTLAQNEVVNKLLTLYQSATIDRREHPSHGYRAVHVILRPRKRPIEVQVRTVLQHLWAEFSEKTADTFGIELKYGGGDKVIRILLDSMSELVARFERMEKNREQLGDEFIELRDEIETILQKLLKIKKEQK